MRVLHLTLSFARGGRRTAILCLAKHLAARGVECSLGALLGLGCTAEEAQRFPAPVEAFRKTSLLDMAAIRRIARYCRDQRIDIVHTHDAASQFAAVLARVLMPRLKVLTTFHRSLSLDSLTLPDRVRNGVSNALSGAVVVASRERREFFLRNNWVRAEKVVRIPLGTELERFHPDDASRTALRAELGIGPETLVIGATGHFGSEKGIDIAIQSFQELCRRRDPASLLMVVLGEGNAVRSALVRDVAARDPRARVVFAGFRPDPERWFSALDVFLHTPRLEAFGLVLVEAMATGLPVVSVRTGGIPDIVRDGETGILAQPENPREIAQALDNMLGDAPRRAEMAEQARRVALAEFNPQTYAERHHRLYEQMLGDGTTNEHE